MADGLARSVQRRTDVTRSAGTMVRRKSFRRKDTIALIGLGGLGATPSRLGTYARDIKNRSKRLFGEYKFDNREILKHYLKMDETNICYGCQAEKRLSEFSTGRRGAGKLDNICKSCNRTGALEHYRANREEINRARMRPIDYWFRKAIVRGAATRKKNQGALFAAIRRVDKLISNRVHSRLKRTLRRRLQKVLAGNYEFSKTARELLGCEVPQLKAHLEALWKPGMTWGNRGFYGWHIDHVVPCAKFDLRNLEERKECFHFSNLQPLWAKENFDKRDR